LKTERGRGHLVTPNGPFFMEGEKTLGFEICEQLRWEPPSRIVVPMGTGGLITTVWKSINELADVDFVDQASTMMTGVQAEGCSPIVEAFRSGSEDVEPLVEPKTFAVDIRVGDPPLGRMALKAMGDSRGSAIAVPDSEILEATRTLARTEGIFAEPAAASTIAGLKRLVEAGEVERGEDIVCIITGAGLKDLSTARRLINRQRRVKMLVYGVEDRRLTARLGETKVRILTILADKELYGYGIWRSLREDWSLKMTIPSVYQHLYELEALGLIRRGEAYVMVGNRRRRYYTLTDKGREALNTVRKLGI
jgi:threonine synthase